MTTIARVAHEQAPLIVIVIGIGYVFVAAGRWSWTMLPDAGLAAFYLWRPSIAMLAFVGIVGVVRHTPTLAGELAGLFQLDRWDGWTSVTIHYLLPALPAPRVETGPTRVLHMSSPTLAAPKTPGMDAVFRPVDQTGMAPPDQPDPRDITGDWEMPPVTPFLTDDEFIVFLATQKTRSGKYRLSANDIVKAAGGDRNHVLSLVRQVRDPSSATYRPLTPDHQTDLSDG